MKLKTRSEAEDVGQELSPLSTPHLNPAKEWKKAKLKDEDLLALVNSGLFERRKWICGAPPYPMEKNPDEIPMFAWFVECGLELPATDFFKGMLRYYRIEYLNLNPNDIFHISIFVRFCEAFVGIKTH
jgi:hypothetical protein